MIKFMLLIGMPINEDQCQRYCSPLSKDPHAIGFGLKISCIQHVREPNSFLMLRIKYFLNVGWIAFEKQTVSLIGIDLQ